MTIAPADPEPPKPAAPVVPSDPGDVQPGIDLELDREVTELLERWRHKYRGNPRAERRRLLLLALEREQIVTVAYREDVLAERVAALDVPPELRQLLRRALAWTWRDEALHVEWVRGRLRNEHRPVPTGILFGHQITGLVSGWVATTRQHPTAGRRAAELMARALVRGALITRRVSPLLAAELRLQTFSGYCHLNAALERTAERTWFRLAELADGAERAEMERIATDEANHRAVFSAIAAVLDDDDRLRPGVSIDDLAARFARISPWFLPSDRRHQQPSSLGRGLPVTVTGVPPESARTPTPTPTPGAGAKLDCLRRAVTANDGLARVNPGDRVAIRTSFMMGYHRDDMSTVVDPGLLDGLAALLLEQGAAEVAVIDVPSVYDRYVQRRSVAEVACYFGYTSARYRIVDAEADQTACSYPRGLGRTTISRTWLDADYRVILAKAVTDPVEFGHLCLCTLEGTGGRVDQTIYLGRYTDFRSATMMVLDLAPPDLAVVDAWGPVGDGPVGVMGSHRPCHPRRIYAGADALAVDLAALADMGGPDPALVPMLAAAAQWLGLELAPPEVQGRSGRWQGGYRGPDATAWSRLVCRIAYPIYTYGGAEGSRFLPAFDPEAFPAKPARWDIRASRCASQVVFGLHPPSNRRTG